jgi:hypothetical protein
LYHALAYPLNFRASNKENYNLHNPQNFQNHYNLIYHPLSKKAMTESKSEDEVISHDGENMAAGSAPIRLYNCTNILPPFSSKSMPKSSLESTYKTYPSNDNDNKPPSAPSSLPLDTTPSSDNLLAKSAQLLNCAWIPGQVSHANSIELQKFIDFIDCFPPGTDDAVVLKATYEALNTQQGKTWFRQAECTVGMLKRELVEALGADVRCATTNAYVTEILEFRQKQLAQKKGVGNPNFDGTAEAVRRLQEHMLEDLEEARKLVAGCTLLPLLVGGLADGYSFHYTGFGCALDADEEAVWW